MREQFPFCSAKFMTWAYRSKLIKRHIDVMKPDVLGLCELDCFKTDNKNLSKAQNEAGKKAYVDLVKWMRNKGYEDIVCE